MSSNKVAIVCGGRTFNDYARVKSAILTEMPTFVIEGDAGGADKLAGEVCNDNGIDYVKVPALWDARGKSAGFRRNSVMLKMLQVFGAGNETVVIAMPGGRGTAMMVDLAEKAGVRVVHG